MCPSVAFAEAQRARAPVGAVLCCAPTPQFAPEDDAALMQSGLVPHLRGDVTRIFSAGFSSPRSMASIRAPPASTCGVCNEASGEQKRPSGIPRACGICRLSRGFPAYLAVWLITSYERILLVEYVKERTALLV